MLLYYCDIAGTTASSFAYDITVDGEPLEKYMTSYCASHWIWNIDLAKHCDMKIFSKSALNEFHEVIFDSKRNCVFVNGKLVETEYSFSADGGADIVFSLRFVNDFPVRYQSCHANHHPQ